MILIYILFNFINIINNQYLNLKFTNYVRQRIIQSILNSKLWNIYYIILFTTFIKLWRNGSKRKKNDKRNVNP